MKIQGLRRFLEGVEDQFLEPFELRKTTLIVDGNNLAYKLYKRNEELVKLIVFGGDYDVFYSEVIKIFSHLLKCKVDPIVLFNGCDFKLAIRSREKGRMNKLKNVLTKKWEYMYPSLLFHVIVEALADLKVRYLQLYENATKEIAALAKHLNYPVLSDNIMFYIYNIDVIPTRHVDFTPRTRENSNFFIECKFYRSGALSKIFPGLKSSSLPLVSILAGTSFGFKGYIKHDINTAFKILQHTDDVNQLERETLNIMEKRRRGGKRFGIQVLERYKMSSTPRYLSMLGIPGQATSDTIPMVFGRDLSKLPRKLLQFHEQGKLGYFILDLILNNRYLLPIFIGDAREKSVHESSKPIIKAICCVLGSVTDMPKQVVLNMRVECKLQDVVLEYGDLNFATLNKNIMEESRDIRRSMFCTLLALTQEDKELERAFDDDWFLFVISVKFWMSVSRPSSMHLSAVLLMAVNTYVKGSRTGEREEELDGRTEPERVMSECDDYDLAMYKFMCLQSLMVHMHYLNNLLAQPFLGFQVSKFWSGTRFFSYYLDFIKNKDSQALVQEYTVLKTAFTGV